MVTIVVEGDVVAKEYEKESKELISLLRNSNSKYKDTEESKMEWLYSFSFFKNKGEYTPEYYEKLFKMEFDERYAEELKKIRVSLSMSAGYFYITDRVSNVSETIKQALKMITAQKMVNEQAFLLKKTGKQYDNVVDSIPLPKEEHKPLSLEEQLQKSIESEDYMEAARIRDEIRKTHEN
jgi:hypothetical protein